MQSQTALNQTFGPRTPLRHLLFAACLLAFAPCSAAAQIANTAPQPTMPPPAIVKSVDEPFPGVVTLDIDATDLSRRIFWIKQEIPVPASGDLVLTYAQWIPGNHAPRGPIYNYAGLKITGGGKTLKWTRDPVENYSFHVEVPNGVKTIAVESQFLTPLATAQGGAMMTPDILRMNWYVAALYPAGYYARQIPFDVSIKLPRDWKYGTALETEARSGDTVKFKRASWETVIDSPLIAGAHFKQWDLNPKGTSRVTLNVAGDNDEAIDATEAMIAVHRTLVEQADKLFRARHFDHYDFLLTVSDQIATAGIEHARSSDNGVRSGYFRNWASALVSRDLLPHEYTHSWNGKYRRPADLWTQDFATPMRTSLLWVYEGQTQYWGTVLAARAGFLTKQQALDRLAQTAAIYAYRKGRDWRPLVDTTMDPAVAARRSLPWRSWQRSEDYYSEGLLIWLDADTYIREKSKGRKSLDDFAAAFFGVRDGDWGQLPYTRADLVSALKGVEERDWEAFFRTTVDDVAPEAPLGGLERGGYKLVYREKPTDFQRASEANDRAVDHTYSIGLSANSTGEITSVLWEGPAFKAGLTTRPQIVAVNGKEYSPAVLNEAVTNSTTTPIELTLKEDDRFRTVKLDYAGGARYPALERIAGTPDRLGDIFSPR
jgi:predicted metalloprotease with PDZ domain